ncbi:carbohydrate sulfotransferase 14-like isoform X2 [Stylophora pistillata]|uniref:carbohydrate sulfotransferase 14-like isoform X2 n=1 Tax=Stylophora pistillata TaxID=50429 RepID=UPI000C041307|nr:carbohydrate sulfotransferase 14-like isoform X2 [Stylophora pistillata]
MPDNWNGSDMEVSKSYTWRLRLTALLSGKGNGEMRISGSRKMTVKNYVATSEQRLQSVKEVCGNMQKSWDSLSKVEKQILGKHILVDDEHRFLYCSVPKAACSNWKRVMMVLDGQAIDANAIRRVLHNSFTVLSDFSPGVIKHKLREYYKFMFVREPFARLLSAYKDKFVLNNTAFHKTFGTQIVKHARKNAPANPKGNDVKVEEFLQYVVDSHVEDMNEHWMPFYKLCQPCVVSYDFIGSMENLESDSTRVLKVLNVDKQVSFPRQQRYYQAGGKGYVKSKKVSNIPPDMMGKVLKKFALDYKLFSYQMPNQ